MNTKTKIVPKYQSIEICCAGGGRQPAPYKAYTNSTINCNLKHFLILWDS